MSREQNAGHYHNIRIGDKSFERVGKFKYLGIILKIQTKSSLTQGMSVVIWCSILRLQIQKFKCTEL